MNKKPDFFQRQSSAHRKTKQLVLFFGLAVICIILILHVLVTTVLGVPLTDLSTLAGTTAVTLTVVLGGALFKTASLSKGGAAVAGMMGGERVDLQTSDPALRRLLNVVEEMAVASGVPVPEIYVMEQEPGINAFAAGHTVSDAAIGVTRGCVETLSRDELQGVIAHEFSHILNGDMRLNIRLIGVLFGILCLAVIGRVLLQSSFYARVGSRNSRDNSQMLFLATGLSLLVIGSIGVFFAKLIQAAVSRQREFLADASAVQFTRNPLGIAGALYKIGNATSRLTSPHTAETSHMLFGNGLGASFSQMFATHPPIPVRLDAILPGFSPEMLPAASESSFPKTDNVTEKKSRLPVGMGRGRMGFPIPQMAGNTPSAAHPIEADYWVDQAGVLESEHVEAAMQLLDSLPENFREACRDPRKAQGLIFSFLLSDDASIRSKQLASLPGGEKFRAEVLSYSGYEVKLSAEQEISIVELSVQGLRNLSPPVYRQFKELMTALIAADGQVNLFEFMVQKMVETHLDRHFSKLPPERIIYHKLMPLMPSVSTLLYALSFVGSSDSVERLASYQSGIESLGEEAGSFASDMGEAPGVREVGRALDVIVQASLELKKSILTACGNVVIHDGKVAPAQAQLIRAIADALGCPVPILREHSDTFAS
ncbi:MAG: M48 family metallopeptidase [Chthoniobacterales bacterium]